MPGSECLQSPCLKTVSSMIALFLSTGEDPQIQESNLPRELIRKFFPRRNCFVLDQPTNDKKLLQHMEDVSENQLDLNFQEQSKNFCQYIFTHAKTKTIREEIIITGNGESSLLQPVCLQSSVCDCTVGLLVIVFPSLCDVDKAEIHAPRRYACVFFQVSLYEGCIS